MWMTASQLTNKYKRKADGGKKVEQTPVKMRSRGCTVLTLGRYLGWVAYLGTLPT